jgi:hypothetical protein
MERVGVDESLIGDLVERHRAGQSALWLWQQTIIAVMHQFVSVVQQDPTRLGIAAGVAALALSLPYVWMHVLWHYAVLLDMTWYPRSINWLALSSPQVFWQILVFLHPWAWTYMAAWCVMLAGIAWCLVRLKPSQRGLILAVFVLSNVGQRLPTVERSFLDWWHAPANPLWISNVVSTSIFVFVMIPLSILAGGRGPQRGGGSTTRF